MGTTYSPFRGNQLLSEISGAVQQAMAMKKQQEQQEIKKDSKLLLPKQKKARGRLDCLI